MPPVSYRHICEQLQILKADGAVDPGMAKLIEQGYEPKKSETRARLKLATVDVCEKCHRPLKVRRRAQKRKARNTDHRLTAWLLSAGGQKSDELLRFNKEE